MGARSKMLEQADSSWPRGSLLAMQLSLSSSTNLYGCFW